MSLRLPSPYADRLLRDEPLARFTAARLGGPGDLVYIARESTDELAAVVSSAWAQDVPVYILGGGANVLISDTGVRGLVVVNHVDGVTFGDEGNVDVESGHALTVLARKCAARGLAGFEWASSVPGTIGGAVVNNAGAHGGDMAGNIVNIEIMDVGTRNDVSNEFDQQVQTSNNASLGFEQIGRAIARPYTMTRDQLAYAYRTSALKARADRRFLMLRARLHLTPDDPDAIQARMDAFIAHRKRTQPPGASLGSIFKNPPGDYAGRLIESCGLKGYSIGGAQVSPLHANFFINTGSATSSDYAALVRHVQAQVAQQTGVTLETEIEML
ncbi:MAG: FAD-binding protein [Chloroflexota bacterium]|nr:FAD-binding protein [Chloroflexota bacterium]